MLKWKVSKDGEGGEREGGDRETKGGLCYVVLTKPYLGACVY